jgi:hypothetical protein
MRIRGKETFIRRLHPSFCSGSLSLSLLDRLTAILTPFFQELCLPVTHLSWLNVRRRWMLSLLTRLNKCVFASASPQSVIPSETLSTFLSDRESQKGGVERHTERHT